MMEVEDEVLVTDSEEDDDEVGSLMPPWYRFVNERRGDGHYLLLPDKRQEKEWKYSRIGHAEQVRIYTEQLKQNPLDVRPHLNIWGEENMVQFINTVEEEPKGVLKAYNLYRQMYNDPEEQETMYWVKEAWHELSDCHETFPIAENITDWKEALITTAMQWTNTKIARDLPFFYQDYLFRNAAGITNVCDEESVATYRKMVDNYKESILLGREISGEARDFNF